MPSAKRLAHRRRDLLSATSRPRFLRTFSRLIPGETEQAAPVGGGDRHRPEPGRAEPPPDEPFFAPFHDEAMSDHVRPPFAPRLTTILLAVSRGLLDLRQG